MKTWQPSPVRLAHAPRGPTALLGRDMDFQEDRPERRAVLEPSSHGDWKAGEHGLRPLSATTPSTWPSPNAALGPLFGQGEEVHPRACGGSERIPGPVNGPSWGCRCRRTHPSPGGTCADSIQGNEWRMSEMVGKDTFALDMKLTGGPLGRGLGGRHRRQYRTVEAHLEYRLRREPDGCRARRGPARSQSCPTNPASGHFRQVPADIHRPANGRPGGRWRRDRWRGDRPRARLNHSIYLGWSVFVYAAAPQEVADQVSAAKVGIGDRTMWWKRT